tara:strand:+ start:304 stop:618 length:315 start_codon:yes stop_codon:yes gene_type:complete
LDLKIIELQRQLSDSERNTFNYKYSRLNKSVGIYAVLALFLGVFGAHKFYIGQIGVGIIYVIFFWTSIPWIIAIIEAIFSARTINAKNYEIANEIFEELKLLRY